MAVVATNNASILRRELMTHLVRLLIEDRLVEDIDRIPIIMRPRDKMAYRDSVAKDRAVLKYQLMAFLGFNIQDEEDELAPLSTYARRALDRRELTDVILTVVDEACSSCHKAQHVVTNQCRACLARPCTLNCPKKTIDFVEGHAYIHQENCVNCGMCKEVCPYNAIIYSPVPCEAACPVDAIFRNEQGVEHIDETKCVSCGKCKVACPFGAVMEKSHLVEIFSRKREGHPIAVMVAPAIAAQFNTSLGRVLHSFKLLGFDYVYEVAQGADVTTSTEAAELKERLAAGAAFMTTSCCPGYTGTVRRHIPELVPFVSHTLSPMAYAAQIAKREHPEAVTVFVSPCSAKRYEAFHDPNVDYVLTFEEYGAWLIAAGVDVNTVMPELPSGDITQDSRFYGRSAGVFTAVKNKAGDFPIRERVFNGVDKAAIRELKRLPKSSEFNFVEVMMCEGGCIGGPNTLSNPRVALRQLQKANDEAAKAIAEARAKGESAGEL